MNNTAEVASTVDMLNRIRWALDTPPYVHSAVTRGMTVVHGKEYNFDDKRALDVIMSSIRGILVYLQPNDTAFFLEDGNGYERSFGVRRGEMEFRLYVDIENEDMRKTMKERTGSECPADIEITLGEESVKSVAAVRAAQAAYQMERCAAYETLRGALAELPEDSEAHSWEAQVGEGLERLRRESTYNE